MKIIRIFKPKHMTKQNNIHIIDHDGNEMKLGIFGDLHWDNPKCVLKTLKKDMDYCLKNNIKMFFVGDLFCLMQGKGDRRGSKSDIRPEHNNGQYFDSIVDTAVDWFAPYAHLIIGVGYGNHETSIIKFHETDILKRWVDKMNLTHGSKIQLGGYGGWIVVRLIISNSTCVSFKGKYFHGSGGGGIVTRGEINLTRALEIHEDFDFYAMGHIHENKSTNVVRDTLESQKGEYYIRQKNIHMMICGTYKEEFGDGSKGWHIERNAPVKPLGGRIIVFSASRGVSYDGDKRSRKYIKQVDSMKFPL